MRPAAVGWRERRHGRQLALCERDHRSGSRQKCIKGPPVERDGTLSFPYYHTRPWPSVSNWGAVNNHGNAGDEEKATPLVLTRRESPLAVRLDRKGAPFPVSDEDSPQHGPLDGEDEESHQRHPDHPAGQASG
jgi:hypothetical protein